MQIKCRLSSNAPINNYAWLARIFTFPNYFQPNSYNGIDRYLTLSDWQMWKRASFSQYT